MEQEGNHCDHGTDHHGEMTDVIIVPSFRRFRLIKTGCMALIWMSMGLYVFALGPTLIDLTHHFKVNFEELSHAVIVRSVGIVLGSFIGGFISDKFNRHADFFLASSLLLLAGSTAAIPWCPGLIVLGVCFLAQGLSHGALSAGGNAMVVAMWDAKSASPLQAVHTGFGVGALSAPLITGPFLSKCINKTKNSTLLVDQGLDAWDNSTLLVDQGLDAWGEINRFFDHLSGKEDYDTELTCGETHIQYAYGIIGGIILLTSVIFYIFYIISKRVDIELSPRSHQNREEKSVSEIINPGSCAQGNKAFAIQLLGLLFLYMVGDVCKAGSTNNYIFTISVKEMKFSKPLAVIFNMTFYSTIAIGRLIGMLFAKFTSLNVLLIVGVFLNVAAQACTLLSLNWSQEYFWILSCVYGTVASPMIPLCIAWADRYIDVGGCVMSLMDFGISAGDFVGTLSSGHLYEHYGGHAVLLLTTGSAGFVVIVTVTMQLIGCIHGTKYSRRETATAHISEPEPVDERTPLIN